MRFRIFIRSMLALSIAFAVASSPNQLSARQTPGTPPPAAATPIVATESALPYLFGNALSLLPPSDSEVVEVIAVGLPVRADVPIAVRNNTGEDVVLKGVFGIARDASGTLIASSDVSSFSPYIVPAGQVAIGSLYFGTTDLPRDVTVEFDPDAEPLEDARVTRQDLEMVEAAQQPDGIVGIARNGTDAELSGPFRVVGVCVDQSGAIQGYYGAYAAKDSLAPGETTSFDAPFYGTGPCDAFLIGSSGFKGD